jgi:hypothetical protein
LGNVARVGGSRKVAVLREREKVVDPVQLHGRCRSGITSANFGIRAFLHPESIQSQGRWIAAGAAADQGARQDGGGKVEEPRANSGGPFRRAPRLRSRAPRADRDQAITGFLENMLWDVLSEIAGGEGGGAKVVMLAAASV